MNHAKKHGGAVAMYVDSSCIYKVIENEFMVVEDLLECPTTEIMRIKRKTFVFTEHLAQT